MANVKVDFKVSMDNEQKLLKNFKKVELEVDFEGVDLETIKKYALKAYVIELQGQVRPNWEKFEKGEYPKVVKFGDAMFSGGRGKVTAEKAATVYSDAISKLSREEKLAKLLADKLISQDMYDMLIAQGVEEQGEEA